ncbi:FMN-binding negative transcriptional regulator [Dasania sp. GY-MA-18]|uniref:FMN-binding negative transcriptional regulator n=1 Tax=Dasania phycosphaerae TaxID=2950436 RepID=A0A9J6RJ64_9GAMM|nr:MULTISPECIES: FMN-binding negative transcriptional regulator [Dasania]MCR8921860.1 FMN-binding negative transcriptional regulator [Dasania sp. GY-MA-18]MCZ0864288.1 FMN-binding negative transcriptional regulator [Dasania phycosphaerae]MCZ0868016.1 FMN-binding negative transcriptional regulator [Dasania phycosphaerae]
MSVSKVAAGKILASSLEDVGKNMFVPQHFDFSKESELIEYIKENPFAQFFSSFEEQLQITATPLIYANLPSDSLVKNSEPQTPEFFGHVAKRNPHCAAVLAGVPAVALLQGPDAYISPRWYVEEPKIPTWSYVAVQVQGQFIPIEDHEETLKVLEATIIHMERNEKDPWRYEDTDPKLLDQYSKGVLAFRFRVTGMQGIKRLGQSRDLEDMRKVMQGLTSTEDANALKIASMMQANIDRVIVPGS